MDAAAQQQVSGSGAVGWQEAGLNENGFWEDFRRTPEPRTVGPHLNEAEAPVVCGVWLHMWGGGQLAGTWTPWTPSRTMGRLGLKEHCRDCTEIGDVHAHICVSANCAVDPF